MATPIDVSERPPNPSERSEIAWAMISRSITGPGEGRRGKLLETGPFALYATYSCTYVCFLPNDVEDRAT